MFNTSHFAYRNGGNFIGFIETVSAAARQDILVSDLCAQIMASRLLGEDVGGPSWAEQYLTQLQRFAWSVSGWDEISLPATELPCGSPWELACAAFKASACKIPTGFTAAAVQEGMMQLFSSHPLPALACEQLTGAASEGGFLHSYHFSVGSAPSMMRVVRLSFCSSAPQTAASALEPIRSALICGNFELLQFSAVLSDVGYDDYREPLKAYVEGLGEGACVSLGEYNEH